MWISEDFFLGPYGLYHRTNQTSREQIGPEQHRNDHQPHLTFDRDKYLTPNYKKQELHSHIWWLPEKSKDLQFFLFQATHILVGKVENMHMIIYMQMCMDPASVSRSYSLLWRSCATLSLSDTQVSIFWAAQKIWKPSQFRSWKWSPAQAFWFYILP